MSLPNLRFVHSLYIYYIYTFIIIYYLCIIVDIRETAMKKIFIIFVYIMTIYLCLEKDWIAFTFKRPITAYFARISNKVCNIYC